ncbi:MAG: DUF2161 family putative PD-(D/E)XK-type phosphodiesterase [Clostridiales bacterium]|jgi:hypothetical protein|nr:DUF2161 family putative PD-(D/E)XK-type phosphodiesterase [Clostridiales bacterium]
MKSGVRWVDKLREADLYAPVRDFLVNLGYDVKGEVKGCDMTAVREDTLVIVELKRSFNAELVFQAIERQKTADSVYVAIPRPKSYTAKRWRDTLALAARLELGIIVVAFTAAGPVAEIACHPREYTPRRKTNKRLAILREHNGRTGDRNTGGVNKTKLMTAYREQCLHIAAALEERGALTSKALRALGTCDKTAGILRRNFYQWFEKIENNDTKEKSYRVSEAGRAALAQYGGLTEYYKSITKASP